MTALGYQALYNNTGSFNTAVGNAALISNTSGASNVALGDRPLDANTSGSINTAVGNNALGNNLGGGGNTAMGADGLFTNTSGSDNSSLGYSADVSTGGLGNATAIGYNATVNASNKIRFGNSSVTVVEGPVSYTVSDGRFKSNVKENIPGLDFINSLKPVSYQYKSYEFDRFLMQNNPKKLASLDPNDYKDAESLVHMGFIAQDVDQLVKQKGYPFSIVHTPTNATDNYSIAYGEFIVPLVKGMQEQQKQIEELKGIIQKQQHQINQLISSPKK
jgi:hypothetical protein